MNQFLCIIALISSSISLHSQSLTADTMADGILIREGNDKVLFYQLETKSQEGLYPRANYIHPLYGIDGMELTEDFPEDHLHHRGIFWAWHQIYVKGKRIADQWECKDIEWDVLHTKIVSQEDGSLSLFVETDWKSSLSVDDERKPFLRETTIITAHPKVENHRVIDINISLQALVTNLKIGGSEDNKGYGGFSVRMKMPSDIVFNSVGEDILPVTGQIDAGPWMNISGSLSAEGDRAGIVIMSHKDNPGNQNKWILRKARSMQNAVYPGRETVEISDTTPTILQYRLIVYKGDLDNMLIGQIFSTQP